MAAYVPEEVSRVLRLNLHQGCTFASVVKKPSANPLALTIDLRPVKLT